MLEARKRRLRRREEAGVAREESGELDAMLAEAQGAYEKTQAKLLELLNQRQQQLSDANSFFAEQPGVQASGDAEAAAPEGARAPRRAAVRRR